MNGVDDDFTFFFLFYLFIHTHTHEDHKDKVPGAPNNGIWILDTMETLANNGRS